MKRVLSVFLIANLLLGIALPVSAFAASGETEDNSPVVSIELATDPDAGASAAQEAAEDADESNAEEGQESGEEAQEGISAEGTQARTMAGPRRAPQSGARIYLSATIGGKISGKDAGTGGATKIFTVNAGSTVELTGDYSVLYGDAPYTLTAEPESGYIFDGWYTKWNSTDPQLVSTSATYIYDPSISETLTASFKASSGTGLTVILSVPVNVTPPTAGTTVGSASGAVSVPSDADYSIAAVSYYVDDPTAFFEGSSSNTPTPLPNEASFAAGYTYYVAVTLSANDGYMFAQASPYTRVQLTGATLTSGSYLSVTNGYWEGFAFSTGTVVASFTIPAATGVADSYVDNTVDSSVSYVTGNVHITGTGGTQAGYNTDGTGKTVYDNSATVTYSNPRTEQVQGMINDAYTKVNTLANACKKNGSGGEFHMSTSESTGRVWDNRQYTTYTYNNASSQWEESATGRVYTGEIPSNAGTNTRIHVASGDFGKETFYRVEANGWVSGYAITITSGGNGTASADLEDSLAGETVTLTATPDSGYTFKEWQVISGGATLTDDSFSMPAADVEIKAIFESIVTYNITATASPTEGGTISGAGTYNGGSCVTVTATPNTGYRFVKWTEDGADVSTEASYTFNASADVTLTANFEMLPTYSITVSNDGNGTGTANPASGPEGTEITLTATPNEGYRLKEWQVVSGSVTVTDNKFTLGSANVDIKAIFELIPTYTVTFNMDGGPDIAEQVITEGGKVTKPADPTKEGYIFGGWYQDATFSVVFDFNTAIQADATIYAKWEKAGYVLTTVTGATTDASHTWIKGSTSDVVITVKLNDGVDNSFAHFTGVQFDGAALVNVTDYTAREGSTVVSLKASMLQDRAVGAHTVTILFDDGQVSTTVTVKAASSTATSSSSSPKTGDESYPGFWITVMVFSGLGLVGLVVTDKKRRYVSKH